MPPVSRSPHDPRLALVSGDDAPAGLAEALRGCAEAAGWSICASQADDAEDLVDDAVALALAPPGCEAGLLRRNYPHALIVTSAELGKADLVVPGNAGEGLLRPLLAHAREQWQRNRKILSLHRELGARRERMRQLSDIALSLSTRMEFPELLETILCEARKLAGCEAGSLYLVDDESSDEPELVFKLAQNDAVDVPFVEGRLPLTPTSLAGYVALSGDTLDIPDAYQIPPGRPYRFNRSFDEDMGYRTRSLLVIPMRDHRDKIVGVLQFINRLDPTEDQPVPFGEEIGELLRAVASQAAVSIQKNTLIRDVHRLFESFVQASVKTIEQRDPSTSGHSFRVAQTTVALLEALPVSGHSRFAALTFTPEHIREVRYAALLHDFGKIGVRENILLKANKLSDDRLEVIHYRVELQKERLRRRAVDDAHVFPRHVQFFGDQRGQGGVDTLTHLGAGGDKRHALLVDDDPRVERHLALADLQGVRQLAAVLPDAEGDAARNGRRADQERAPCDLAPVGHGSGLPQTGRGRADRGADARIRPASAQVARHGGVDLVVRGLRCLSQQRCGLHDLSGLAVAALRDLVIDPGSL